MGLEVARTVRQLERDLGNPVFTYAGTDYPCCPNEPTISKTLGLGGFAPVADLVLFVRVKVLPAVGPIEKQTVSYAGRRYRIDQIGTLPGREVLIYTCSDPAKTA